MKSRTTVKDEMSADLSNSSFKRTGRSGAAPTHKRGLVITAVSLLVMGASLSTSYLGATGTVSASVTPASANSSFVYPVSSGSTVPTAVTSLAVTPHSDMTTAGTVTTAVSPTWSPNALAAGSVTTAGDLALIDGTIASNGVVVSMYITNLAALQADYSSFALPVTIYSAPSSSCISTGCTWTVDTTATPTTGTYITSTGGFIGFNLPAGSYYDITLNTGGSYYCTATTVSSTAALSPAFYFTAQPY